MTLIFPGATWRPQPGQEKRPARRKGRGVGFHVAVYLGPSIWDINRRTGNDAHLYVRRDGSVEQNIDLNLQAWAGGAGNGTMIWVETEGGMGTSAQVNAEPWTPQQAETLAQIAAWAHLTEGVPLQVMPDSRPTSRGIGTHRLGIQHSRGVGAVAGWLVPGGETWSSVRGKECPGNAKIAQLPGIVTRSRQIVVGGHGAATSPTSTDPSEEDVVTFVSVKPSDHITIPRPRGGDVVIDVAFDDNGLGYNGKAAEQLVRVAALGKDGTWRSFYKSMEGHDGFTFWVPTAASVAIPLAADDVMCVIRNLHPAWNLGVAINRTA